MNFLFAVLLIFLTSASSLCTITMSFASVFGLDSTFAPVNGSGFGVSVSIFPS